MMTPEINALLTRVENGAPMGQMLRAYWVPACRSARLEAEGAPGITGGWDALTVHGTRLTIWQLAPASRTWAATQAITVPIQFGSSG